mgnify:CR=1 FL=1
MPTLASKLEVKFLDPIPLEKETQARTKLIRKINQAFFAGAIGGIAAQASLFAGSWSAGLTGGAIMFLAGLSWRVIAAGAEWRGLHIFTGSQALDAEARRVAAVFIAKDTRAFAANKRWLNRSLKAALAEARAGMDEHRKEPPPP